jgi:iron complex transport system substrate-binding protein
MLDAQAPVEIGIERMEELATLLGADLDRAEHQAAVADFEEASDAMRELAETKPGLTVAFGSIFTDGLFLAPVDAYPELAYYTELGLDVLSGTKDEAISWELVEAVEADVLVLDDRFPDALDGMGNIDTLRLIPAVGANQAVPAWRFLLSYSRADYARAMNRMLPALEAADPDVVPSD